MPIYEAKFITELRKIEGKQEPLSVYGVLLTHEMTDLACFYFKET